MTVIKSLLRESLAAIWPVNTDPSNGLSRLDAIKRTVLARLRAFGDEKSHYVRGLWLPIAFMMGCALYFSAAYEPGIVLYLGLLAMLMADLYIGRRLGAGYDAFPQFCVLLIFWFTAGLGYSDIRTAFISHAPIKSPLERVMVEGWVDFVEHRESRDRIVIEIHAISGLELEKAPHRVRLSVPKSELYTPGRFLRCFAAINPPPAPSLKGDYAFAREAYLKGLGGVGFSYGRCRAGSLESPDGILSQTNARINQFRLDLAEFIYAHGGEGAGLATALLTGMRGYLSDEEQDTLRASGLAHLLAISGLHMGLAGGAFYLLFFRLLACIEPLAKRYPVQKIAAIAALIGVTAYLLLSGASISAQRAYVMVLIAFLAILLDRPVLSFQTLGLSLLTVLIISPHAVVTPGFQMSFAAAGALVWAFSSGAYKALTNRLPLPAFLSNFLAPILISSVVAGLATMPFAYFHFGRLAPLGILANLVVMPVVTLITVPLGVLSAFAMMIGLGETPIKLFGSSLHLVVQLADPFASEQYGQGVPQNKALPMSGLLALTFGLLILTLSSKFKGALVAVLTGLGFLSWAIEPSYDLVISSTGYTAIHTHGSWQVTKHASAGLIPLGFSNLKRTKCSPECTFDIPHGTIRLTPDAIELNTPAGSTHLTPDQSIGIKLTATGPQHYDLTPHSCRPWSKAWPDCA